MEDTTVDAYLGCVGEDTAADLQCVGRNGKADIDLLVKLAYL